MIRFLFAGLVLSWSGFTLAQSTIPLFTTRQDALFQESYRLAVPEHPESVLTYAWMSSLVDYDNDGSLDVIVYGHHSGDAYIWRGAQGAAEYLQKGNWVFGARDPVWIDVDKDGDLDGIGTEGYGIVGETFLNSGNGMFSKGSAAANLLPTKNRASYDSILAIPSHIPKPVHPLDAKLSKLYFVDLNNDGVDELIPSLTGRMPALKAEYSGYSWVFEQQNGNWVDATEKLGLREGLEQQLFAEDLDMDGDMDLIELFAENIYRNDGGMFTRVSSAPAFGGRRPYDGDGEIAVIDIDNNGFRDLVFGGDHSGASGVYLNTGALSFVRMEGNLVPNSRRTRKFGDVDADGDLDMVVFNEKEMIVYHNVTPNPGMHITFSSEQYFGTHVQVRDSQGKLVFNTQLYQYQHPGMSQVYDTTLHIGGVSGEVEVLVDSKSGQGAVNGGDGTPSFVNNVLRIPGVLIGGGLYTVDMLAGPTATSPFTLRNYQYLASIGLADIEAYSGPKYQDGVLTLPRVRTAGDTIYKALLSVIDARPPMTFELLDVQVQQ